MTQNTRQKVTFALRDRNTGQLARLKADPHPHDRYAPTEYALSSEEDFPVFALEDAGQLALVLLSNTPDFSSTHRLPSWGEWAEDISALQSVKLTTQETVEAVALPELPVLGRTLELRTIHARIAKQYHPHDLTPLKDCEPGFVFWLVHLPQAETVESAQRWEGMAIYSHDRCTKRHAYKVLPVPADYVDVAPAGRAVLILASSPLR